MNNRMNGRILVIDDEESIRYTFRSFLTDEGYDVITASGFDEALEILNAERFDLIITDIILGRNTGMDLIKHLRDNNDSTPVTVITGVPTLDTASESVRLGAFDYLTKPVRQATLLRTADLAIRQKMIVEEKEKYRLNLEAVFRSVRDAIITIDNELELMHFNDSAARLFSLAKDDIGTSVKDILSRYDHKCLRALEKTIEGKETVDISRIECIRGDNTVILSFTMTPLIGHNGNSEGAVIVVRDETRLETLERNLNDRRGFHNIIGKSSAMQKVYSFLDDLSKVQTTVLISGESGTGKELAAEALHFMGPRGGKPLVKVNCSALSENLLESELFGHIKGAFTGAVADMIGRFSKANGGTLFLDEIGDVSQRIQQKLLRVLQEQEFERVGDSKTLRVDVRVIAATNQNLPDKVKKGLFREDLYYRLKVAELHMPPLREKREDIPVLAEHFVKLLNNKLGKNIDGISQEVMDILLRYNYPGNVRELEHIIEYALVRAKKPLISAYDLPADLLHELQPQDAQSKTEDNEKQNIITALEKSGWNKAKAARLLGISRRTIYRKISELNITEPH